MVNLSGENQYDNGTRPPDDELERALKFYAIKGLSRDIRRLYLERTYGYKIGNEKLRQLNNEFNISSIRKPPPYALSKTYVCDKIAKDVSQRNGPNQIKRDLKNDGILIPRDTIRKIMQEEAPDGAQLRDPAGRRKKKVRGHLTGIGVMQECHADGHEKLGKQALRMGNIGIPIYGIREHAAGPFRYLCVVPNDRDERVIGHVYLDFVEINGYIIPQQMTVDGGTETGQMYASHRALRITYLPDLDENLFPLFISIPSTSNTPIESGWSYWQNAKGNTIKAVILQGPAKGYIIGNELHENVFQWLWPKIVQRHLDDFKESFNYNATRYQRDKKLPSGVAPQVVYDFPDRYGLEFLGCKVEPAAIETLRSGIGISREEAFRWVSEEFDARATEAYKQIGSPELECDNGWSIFNEMLRLLDI